MADEIERKFLLSERPPQLEGADAEQVVQGYLALDGETEVRLRRKGARTLLTVKLGSGERRVEEEFDIDPSALDALWPATEGRRVEKRRFTFDEGDVTVEVDVYAGALEGMLTAEIEFPSEEASAAFEPPAWLGREVTGDARYTNQQLALHGRPTQEVAP